MRPRGRTAEWPSTGMGTSPQRTGPATGRWRTAPPPSMGPPADPPTDPTPRVRRPTLPLRTARLPTAPRPTEPREAQPRLVSHRTRCPSAGTPRRRTRPRVRRTDRTTHDLSLIHIYEPTRRTPI